MRPISQSHSDDALVQPAWDTIATSQPVRQGRIKDASYAPSEGNCVAEAACRNTDLSTSNSTGRSEYQSYHETDTQSWVLLQFEHMSRAHVGVVLWASHSSISGGVGGSIALFTYHGGMGTDQAHPLMDRRIRDTVTVANCLCLVLAGIALTGYRIYIQKGSNKTWTNERWRMVMASCLVLVSQAGSLVCSLIPLSMTTAGHCIFFSPLVSTCHFLKTTCNNTLLTVLLISAHECVRWIPGEGQLWRQHPWQHDTAKAFWKAHRKALCLWVVFQLCILAEFIVTVTDSSLGQVIAKAKWVKNRPEVSAGSAPAPAELTSDCFQWNYNCQASWPVDVANGLHVPFFVLFLVLYWRLICRGLAALQDQPYGEDTRLLNIILRIQAHFAGVPFTLMVIATCLIYVIRLGHLADCNNYIYFMYGEPQIQTCLSWLALTIGLLTMPRRPNQPIMPLRLALGQLVWCEAELPERLAQLRVLAQQLAVEKGRGSTSSQTQLAPPADGPDVESRGDATLGVDLPADTPPLVLFCVETMVKLLYWSQFVYRYHKAPEKMAMHESVVQLPVALGLYQLQHVEVLGSRQGGTRALLAWNNTGTLVISLRGTANMRNLYFDMMLWRSSHLPKRGHFWRRPMVHRGFQASYQAGNFPSMIITHIKEVVCRQQGLKEEDLTIHVTGHSLGGCLAMLCAYDIAGALHAKALQVYTFGAPRLGNKVFSRDYDARVPNTWHVINARDTVPYNPGICSLYKRGGHVVMLTKRGDIIIEPSLLERRILPRGGDFRPHFLAAYKAALAQVCKNQVTGRSLPDGVPAVLGLAARLPLAHLLQEAALGAEALRERAVEFMNADESGRRAAMAASWNAEGSAEFEPKDTDEGLREEDEQYRPAMPEELGEEAVFVTVEGDSDDVAGVRISAPTLVG